MSERPILESLLAERGWVVRLARTLARDEASADDLAQESWLGALRHPPEHAANLRSWIGFLLRRKARDRARGEARRGEHEERAARPEQIRDGPLESLERVELVRELAEALAKLPEPYRTAVVLRYVDDLEPRAIAQRLCVNAATVRSRLARGLAMLRGDLERRHGRGREGLLCALTLFSDPGSTAQGALLVGLKTKIAADAALLALLAGLGWRWSRPGAAPTAPLPVASALPVPEQASQPLPNAEGARAAVAWSTASPAEDMCGLRIEVLRAGSGAPLADIGVLTQSNSRSRVEREWEDATDANGIVVKSGLAPGPYDVACDRNADVQRIELARGETRSVRLIVREGVSVRGRVVDLAGKAVPGAGIDVSWSIFRHVGHIALHADTEGRFRLVDLAPNLLIGARMSGYAPSLQRQLAGRPGDELDVVLTLPGNGGSWTGRVLAPDGAPLADARVQARDPRGDGRFELPDGHSGSYPGAAVTRSGPDGSFRLECLAPGAHEVSVQASGFVHWLDVVQIRESAETRRDAQLGRGAALHGRIVDKAGQPLAGVRVQFSNPPEFHSIDTDLDGRFARSGIAGGRYHFTVDGHEQGHAWTMLTLQEGEEREWNATLDPGNVYSGRFVDESGAPLVGWYANVLQTDNIWYGHEVGGQLVEDWLDWWGRATSNAEGRFRVANIPEGMPFRIEVRPPMQFGTKPILSVDDQKPNAPEVTITVPAAALELGQVSGTLVDQRGQPLDDASVTLEEVPPRMGPVGPGSRLERGSGRFTIRNVPHGRWRLNISAPGYVSDLDSFLVESSEPLDLGLVEMRRLTSSLTVQLTRAGGQPCVSASVELLDGAGMPVPSFVMEGSRGSSRMLAAGDYSILVVDRGQRLPLRTITLREGQQKELEVELPALPK